LSRIQSLADYNIDTLESSFQKRHRRARLDRKRFRRLARKTTSSLNGPSRTDDEAAN
jgi:hypothetical protein